MNRFIYSFAILIFSSLNLISQSDKDLELKKEKESLEKEIELINQKKKKLEDKIESIENSIKENQTSKDSNVKERNFKEEDFFKLEDNIVITASRKSEKISEAPAAIYVISEKQIRARGYRTLVDALHDVPGFDFQHTYGTYPELIHQRGLVGENNRTLVYIDGVPDNNINENAVLAGTIRFPLNNVSRIEIVSGPASALYGANAFNGIINIITKDGKREPGNHADFTYGGWEKKFSKSRIQC